MPQGVVMPATTFREILQIGVECNASDWHIREDSTVILRVDGSLREIEGFVPDKEFLDKAAREIATVKDMANYDEHGDADFAHSEDGVGRFRVNLHRQRGLMAFTFRHIKNKVPNLSGLGLPEVLLNIAGSERGIVLVTGTTGSGKSTTMACMLEYMNQNFNRHIITIEDPIEYYFRDQNCVFEQREVGMDTSSFNSALIHALRQDPDVIVVGEMRNRNSFDTALTAADTGHMVMSTLHTSNASQTIQRILDFYSEEERHQIRIALATNLRAIICQRLLPKASGKGVVPANEIMINTAIIRKLLEEDKLDRLPTAIETSTNEGMMSFDQCMLKLVNEGLVSEQLALEKATNPEKLRMNMQGIFLSSGALLG
jgi:twitching motility protein PilT